MSSRSDCSYGTRAVLYGSLLGATLLLFGCIPNEEDVQIPDVDNPFANCLAIGQKCGGQNLCCPGTLCKGGECRQDPTCIGSGGHCITSADCCGLAICKNTVCTTGFECLALGEHCDTSADCCGAGLCRQGACH